MRFLSPVNAGDSYKGEHNPISVKLSWDVVLCARVGPRVLSSWQVRNAGQLEGMFGHTALKESAYYLTFVPCLIDTLDHGHCLH